MDTWGDLSDTESCKELVAGNGENEISTSWGRFASDDEFTGKDLLDNSWGDVPTEGEELEDFPDESLSKDVGQASGVSLTCIPVVQEQKRKPGRPKKDRSHAIAHAASELEHVPGFDTPSMAMMRTFVSVVNGGVSKDQVSKEKLIVPTDCHAHDLQVNGVAHLSRNSCALVHCVVMANSDGAEFDENMFKLEDEFLNPDKEYHLQSIAVRADKLNIEKGALQKKSCRLAAAQHCYLNLQQCMLQALASASQSGVEKVAFVEFCAYDETPMKTTLKGQPIERSTPPEGQVSEGYLRDMATAKRLTEKIDNEGVIAKILQTRHGFGFLLKQGANYIHVLGDVTSPLAAMERGTSEVLKSILLRQSVAWEHTQAFHMRTRAVTTDAAHSNIKTECSINHDRGKGWKPLALHCEVHYTSNTCKRVIPSIVPEVVSGLLHTALSLQHGSGMTVFRACLRAVIQERLQICKGAPGLAADEYRLNALRLFGNKTSNLGMVQNMLLLRLCNGDWRKTHTIEHYQRPLDHALDRQTLVDLVCDGMIVSVAGQRPVTFPQHRWTGADKAVEQIGLLSVIHNVLRPAYERFCVVMSKPDRGASSSSHGEIGGELVADVDVVDQSELGGAVEDMEGQAVLPEEGGQGKSAEEHSKNRRHALVWLRREPLAQLMVMRTLLEPIRILLVHQFKICSEEFELEQRSLVANSVMRCAQAGLEGDEGPCPRDWSVTIAAKQEGERLCFEALNAASYSPAWGMLPDSALTCAVQCQIFRQLSRLGTCIEQFMSWPHACFPYKLFKLIHMPSAREEILSCPTCLMDEWSKAVVETLRDSSEQHMRQVLIHHCLQLPTSIAHLEARHASIRRSLHTLSTQTWSVRLSYASALHVFQCLRRVQSSPLQKHVLRSSKQKATLKKDWGFK
eukprot:2372506-Amphidinium_carterae.2